MAVAVEALGGSFEGKRISGNVPERLAERSMTKIAAEQEKVMSHGRLLLTPLGDQPGGQGVTEIVKPRISARASNDEISGEAAKRIVHSLLF